MRKKHRPHRRGRTARSNASLSPDGELLPQPLWRCFWFRAEFKQLQSGCGSRSRLKGERHEVTQAMSTAVRRAKGATATSCCAEGASVWSVFFSKGDRCYLRNQLLEHIFNSYFCRMEKAYVTFLSLQHLFCRAFVSLYGNTTVFPGLLKILYTEDWTPCQNLQNFRASAAKHQKDRAENDSKNPIFHTKYINPKPFIRHTLF